MKFQWILVYCDKFGFPYCEVFLKYKELEAFRDKKRIHYLDSDVFKKRIP